ncbi:hypothetical protein TanjilG_11763 [Lupinus angustifolius]|uniref:B box-type domain-containing protein n=1 Tax=Lupinus angustifolius TaxID=3871 RepID=A0A394DBE5_LUPAN|nr:PREDICTED: uncharacterized protein LOC109338335 [Lupinus angustifolius]XP_019431089.1 PREDICTED: uncharacterized protein LOC109338336 [Lupinus angustifolius]OIW20452.1 hypothetical protein TanjilG_11762 [Lupinus angustifolius]OIW20453.1 hypothetical protein TanjilG_11763 [Lupinus angustifolius]
MKKCELCKVAATTFCDSDQASLCWDCDTKVHGANFLVARHTRTLLCHACQNLTPWKASGATLGNTVSMCQGCAGGARVNAGEGEESEGDNDDEIDSLYDEDEDGDNQVVPLSSTATAPPACSSSTGEGSVIRCSRGDDDVSESSKTASLKRRREDNDFQEGSKRRNVYGANQREPVDLIKCDSEPPLNVSPAVGRFNGSRGCCDSKESEGN